MFFSSQAENVHKDHALFLILFYQHRPFMCVCTAAARPQLQGGGAGGEAEEAGGDVPVGGVQREQVSALFAHPT